MSREDGHLSVSGTKIEDFEYTKQNVIALALHGLLYTHLQEAPWHQCNLLNSLWPLAYIS